MELHGGNIYDKEVRLDFSININPFGMPERVRKNAIRGIELSENYPDLEQRELLKGIADYMDVSSSRIVIGNGTIELIYTTMQMIRPKKAFIIGPTFSEYERALKHVQCECHCYLAKETDGFEVLKDVLSALDRVDYDMVCICNPNNPTGRLLKKELMAEILERTKERKIPLLIDESFMPFVRNEQEHSLLGKVIYYNNLIVLRAFTEIFAMPGLRLAYATFGDKKRARQIKEMLPPWNISVTAQLAGVAALKEFDYVERARDYITSERVYMEEQLKKLSLQVIKSKTNFVLFKGPTSLQTICLKQGILIRDGAAFAGIPKGYYRIGIKKREQNDKLLAVLRKYLESGNKVV